MKAKYHYFGVEWILITLVIILTFHVCAITCTKLHTPSAAENCHRMCKHWICDRHEKTLCNTVCEKKCNDDNAPVVFAAPIYVSQHVSQTMKKMKREEKKIKIPFAAEPPLDEEEEEDVLEPIDVLRDRTTLRLRRLVNGSIYGLGVIVDGTSTARLLRSTVIAFSRGKVFLVAEHNRTKSIVIPLFDFGSKLVQSIEPEETRGFYGIDFHHHFYLNGKIYISYAAPSVHHLVAGGDVDEAAFNHRLILREFVVDPWMMNHTDHDFLEGRVLLDVGQRASHRVGGYVQMAGSAFSPSVIVASGQNELSRLPASFSDDVRVPFRWNGAEFATWFQNTPLWITLPPEQDTIDSCHRDRNGRTIYCLTTGPPSRRQSVMEIDEVGNVKLISNLPNIYPCRYSSILSYSGPRNQLRTDYNYYFIRPACYTSKGVMMDGGVYGLEHVWDDEENPKELVPKLTPLKLLFESVEETVEKTAATTTTPPLGSRGVTILQNFIEGRGSEMFISAIVGKTYESVLYRVMMSDE